MDEYYSRKSKLILWLYGKLTAIAAGILAESFPEEVVARIVKSTREECKAVIPRLAYIGGMGNAYTPVIVVNGWIVSLYKAMKNEDIDVVVAAYTSREVLKRLINKVPKWIGIQIGKLAFTQRGINYFSKQAELSQEKRYPEDFVYTFSVKEEAGDGIEGVMEFTECAVHKFYNAEGVPELRPFCNFADPLYGARFEMGMNAERTFAQGYPTCQLSFNSQRETHTPDNIKAMIADAEEMIGNAQKNYFGESFAIQRK